MTNLPMVFAASAILTVALACATGLILVKRAKGTPEKREQKRRLYVHRTGRLGDAFITDATDSTIYYEYSIHGVQYTASQDISTLLNYLPSSPERLIGIVNFKYSVRNPANSILLCEEWTGLRPPQRAIAG